MTPSEINDRLFIAFPLGWAAGLVAGVDACADDADRAENIEGVTLTMTERTDAPMLIARHLVEEHIRDYGMVPHPGMLKDAIAAAIHKTLREETATWIFDGDGEIGSGSEKMTEKERLASQLAAVQYNEPAAGNDKRGIIFGLRLDERDIVVRALRENERLRATLIKVANYLDDLGDYPEPGDTIKMIEAALGVSEKAPT